MENRMKTSILMKFLADTKKEYELKQKGYIFEGKWYWFYEGKIDLCNSLITLLKSDE
jgi:hypothetical protein